MASLVYNTWKGKDAHDWSAGANSDYKVMLVTTAYTPNADHDFPADGPAANEVAGGSYARQNVATRTKAIDDGTNSATHSADNPTFTALAGPAEPRYAIIYRVVATDADHQLVCCIDLGAGLSITGDLMVKWDGGATSGIVFTAT